ncbi:MAG TPA: hypothetical protein VGB35_05115 [Gammaproteobacteria bacterium]|jgi:hypothetical protein
MKSTMRLLLPLFPVLLLGNTAMAAEPSVNIYSPADGTTLDVMEQNRVEYEVVPGPHGEHVHFYVDGEETAILRQLKGSHTLGTLAPGERELCIKVVNRNHTPIGVERCISVTVQ